jgi:hypothetical protein
MLTGHHPLSLPVASRREKLSPPRITNSGAGVAACYISLDHVIGGIRYLVLLVLLLHRHILHELRIGDISLKPVHRALAKPRRGVDLLAMVQVYG